LIGLRLNPRFLTFKASKLWMLVPICNGFFLNKLNVFACICVCFFVCVCVWFKAIAVFKQCLPCNSSSDKNLIFGIHLVGFQLYLDILNAPYVHMRSVWIVITSGYDVFRYSIFHIIANLYECKFEGSTNIVKLRTRNK
jgi:hypothetical protein